MKSKTVIFISITLGLIAQIVCATNQVSWQWSWMCNSNTNTCLRNYQEDSINLSLSKYKSLAVCRLICGKYGALWPKPSISTFIGQDIIKFHPNEIYFQILNAENSAKDFLIENINIFRKNIFTECKKDCLENSGTKLNVVLSVTSSSTSLNWDTNEFYTLNISSKGEQVTVHIMAENVYGVRHGLETLTQLIASQPGSSNDNYELVIVKEAKIHDKPVYRHRGLLLDTARNYLSEKTLQRQIDGMAASKLNVLHWHATDSQSFPLNMPKVTQLARFGAYSENQTYEPVLIIRLLKYAKLRGVRIILEIDAPAHSGNGWQWGNISNLGDLAVCVNKSPWRSYCIQPPCGQLNPVNPNLYHVLGDLYSDIIEVFPTNEVFHMGGDEVFIACWNSTQEIIDYLKNHGKGREIDDFLDLWGDYQNKALNAFDSKAGNSLTPIILWSSALTEPSIISKYLPKNRYIIQTWLPSSNNMPADLLNLGYQLVISTKDAWYLDHGFWGSTSYYTWRTVYSNRILRHDGVLGGEVCMWGELVDENNIDSRIWPRAAAAAERLWSDPTSNTASAEPRMYSHRERLVSRKIKADALSPQWCTQNDGQCL